MSSRRIRQEILNRIEVLEKKYQIQEQQVTNLLQLLKEYKEELDRRQRAYSHLLLATRSVTVVILFSFLQTAA